MNDAERQSKLRIIVMDDEPLVLNSVSMLLESLGHEVEQATHGQQVLDILADNRSSVDLAIIDLTVRSGLGAVEIVSDARSISPQTKLVISSGFRGDPVMVEFVATGFHDKLEKPYSLQHLIALIERLGL